MALAPQTAPTVAFEQDMKLQARVDQAISAFRLRGHLRAQLDPLGRPRPRLEHVADMGMVDDKHFSAAELEQLVESADVFPEARVKLKELLGRLRRTYTGAIGVEFMQMLDSERRRWLMRRMEYTENRTSFTVEEQRHILTKLSYAEGFENFLHTKFIGAKRFALDGGEALMPMLDAVLEVGGRPGAQGGRHRHGPPRPPQRADEHPGQEAGSDLQRVRGPAGSQAATWAAAT